MIQLGHQSLSVDDVEAVALGRAPVSLDPRALPNIERSQKLISDLFKDPTKTVYGVNTGFGSLKDVRIEREKVEQLQINLIRSHAAGVGPYLSREAVRAMMLLRATTLSRGYSGVAPATIQLLLDFLTHDVVPAIPSQGSVGASGDLAPLSHLALCLIGEGKVLEEGGAVATQKILAKKGLTALRLGPKEALALINGTQMMTALGCIHWARARRVTRSAHLAAALSLEASLGSRRAFDPRVHALRPHRGQEQVARLLFSLLEGSEILKSHEGCDRVQDAYSLRCVPQVHGVVEDALEFARQTLSTEINSVTDNPLLFSESKEFISAGNFHGQPVSFAMDMLSIALTSMASMSERRTFRLLSRDLSGLPVALVADAGLQSGLMMLQVTSAALVSECKVLSHPASVDSIPTWAEQEDHVSMGAHAARKFENIVSNIARVVAVELICAVQGLGFRRPLKTSTSLEKAVASIASIVRHVEQDRPMGEDIEALATHILDRDILHLEDFARKEDA